MCHVIILANCIQQITKKQSTNHLQSCIYIYIYIMGDYGHWLCSGNSNMQQTHFSPLPNFVTSHVLTYAPKYALEFHSYWFTQSGILWWNPSSKSPENQSISSTAKTRGTANLSTLREHAFSNQKNCVCSHTLPQTLWGYFRGVSNVKFDVGFSEWLQKRTYRRVLYKVAGILWPSTHTTQKKSLTWWKLLFGGGGGGWGPFSSWFSSHIFLCPFPCTTTSTK